MQPVSPKWHPKLPKCYTIRGISPELPPRGTRRTTTSNGTLVPQQTPQLGASAEVGLLDQLTSFVSKNFFIDESPIFVLEPELMYPEMMTHIFTTITEDKDLVSFRITCKTLSRMNLLPNTKIRIFCFAMGNIGDKLIKATAERPLHSDEFSRYAFSPIIQEDAEKSSRKSTIDNESCIEAAQSYETALVKKFLLQCSSLNIREKDFFIVAKMIPQILMEKTVSFDREGHLKYINFYTRPYAYIINRTLNYELLHFDEIKQTKLDEMRSQEVVADNKTILELKLETVIKNFNNNICLHLVKLYARLPIEMIKPCSFEKKLTEIADSFPCSGIDIKEVLLSSIKAAHGPALAGLAQAYLDLKPNNPKIEELKLALKADLENSKTAPNMTDERLYEIETKLANIDATAQMEAQKLGMFYQAILAAPDRIEQWAQDYIPSLRDYPQNGYWSPYLLQVYDYFK